MFERFRLKDEEKEKRGLQCNQRKSGSECIVNKERQREIWRERELKRERDMERES